VIHTESGFSPKAESGVGAIGLMQIMPSTARGIAEQTGIPNTPWDPATNLRMGAWMLSSLLRKWEDPELALASYFAGSGNVQKALDGDYWPESYYNYAHAVISRWEAYGALVRACAA
jgi:soluble lytic murein transglycosylase